MFVANAHIEDLVSASFFLGNTCSLLAFWPFGIFFPGNEIPCSLLAFWHLFFQEMKYLQPFLGFRIQKLSKQLLCATCHRLEVSWNLVVIKIIIFKMIMIMTMLMVKMTMVITAPCFSSSAQPSFSIDIKILIEKLPFRFFCFSKSKTHWSMGRSDQLFATARFPDNDHDDDQSSQSSISPGDNRRQQFQTGRHLALDPPEFHMIIMIIMLIKINNHHR